MSNLLRRKKAFKYSVVSIKIARYIVHYTPHYFYAYVLSLNAFLLFKAITHEISGLARRFTVPPGDGLKHCLPGEP